MNPTEIVTIFAPVMLLVEQAILVLLLFLGLGVLFVFVWRWRSISLASGKPEVWISRLTQDLTDGDLRKMEVSAADRKTVPGRVVHTGVSNLGLAPEALEKVLEVQETSEKRALESGVSFLGTVGSNAPFLGLTGTVIGILVAFDEFAKTGGRGSAEVMSAISGALIATAVGLIVAIPGVVCYNILRNRIKDVMENGREIRGLILARSLHATAQREG